MKSVGKVLIALLTLVLHGFPQILSWQQKPIPRRLLILSTRKTTPVP